MQQPSPDKLDRQFV